MIKNVAPGMVAIKISEEEKRKIFETDILCDNGETLTLIKALRAGSETDEYMSQAVTIGDVIGVGDGVKTIQVGDVAVIDNLVDTGDEYIAYYENRDKVVVLISENQYYEEDKIAYGSLRQRTDSYTWKKGDIKTNTFIYAVYRGGKLIPNSDYVLLEHKNLTSEAVTPSGITYQDHEGDTCYRRVIGVNNDRLPYKVDDIVVVEFFTLFERSIYDMNFDVVLKEDILAMLV